MAIFFHQARANIAQKPSSRLGVIVRVGLFIIALCVYSEAQAGQWFSSKGRAEGDAFYKNAFAAYDSGNYAQAQTFLDQAEKLKPDQADGWNLRGAVYLKQGIYNKAQAAFSRAMTLDPALWAAQFNYSEVAFQSKNFPLARTRFDRLVSQTNRFKQKNQWELAQYKAFLSSLLMNDEAGAQKRLAKLPATGGVTPAYAYAQAAVAFRHKNPAAAQKSLIAAQSGYSPTLNGLFSDSLVAAGWQAPAAVPNPALAAAAPYPMPMGAPQPAFVIDPKIEAAAAEPLPVADATTGGKTRVQSLNQGVYAVPPEVFREQMSAISKPAAAPTPDPDSAIERGVLLD